MSAKKYNDKQPCHVDKSVARQLLCKEQFANIQRDNNGSKWMTILKTISSRSTKNAKVIYENELL